MEKRFKSIGLMVLLLLLIITPSRSEAVEVSNSWMTVSAKNYKTRGFGRVNCDPVFMGYITVTIEYKGQYQTFTKVGSSSGNGGAYTNVYPDFGSVVRAKGAGKVTANGKSYYLNTSWAY